MIDIDSAAKAIFMSMVGMLNEQTNRVYIYVKATPVFLQDNPHMAEDVHKPEGATEGHVVLNVSALATRNLVIEDRILYFDTRKLGRDYTLKVYMGDIIGMGNPDASPNVIYDVTAIPVVSPEGGTMVCRPLGSMDMAEHAAREAAKQEQTPKAESVRPGLRVVK